MDEFTPVDYGFVYKLGSRTFGGAIKAAPSVLHDAKAGDESARRVIRSEVARVLRLQGSGFMSKVLWSKIKWVN